MRQQQQVISDASLDNPFVSFHWAIPTEEQRVSRRRRLLISRCFHLPLVTVPVSDVMFEQPANSDSPHASELIGQRKKPLGVTNQIAGLRSIFDDLGHRTPQGRG